MDQVLTLYKQVGETPLECLNRFKFENTEYVDMPLTYAGRLDPMAEGLLLVLAGEEAKKKEDYLGLDKEYEFEILFGFSTDSHDLLGKISDQAEALPTAEDLRLKIEEILNYFNKKFLQAYPAYSSRTVQGKPLWQWQREGRIHEIEIPTKEVEIYSVQMIDEKYLLKKEDLLKEILERISLVKGDFRQEDIKEDWINKLDNSSLSNFCIFKFKISCSSGTYIRVLADKIGKEIDIPACVYSIKRTRVGGYLI